MVDDPSNRGAQDRARINVREEHERRYWTEALDCTEDQLRAAVSAVGIGADKVREYLGRH